MKKPQRTKTIDNDFLLPKFDREAGGDAQTRTEQKKHEVLELDLSSRSWTMEGIRPGQGEAEGFHEVLPELHPNNFNWIEAEVPGDVYTDLWRGGAIDDPHFGRQSMKAKWVMEQEWWYVRRFNLPKVMQGKSIFLEFEGVDYSCDVWLNGVHLGTHEGMFSPFSFDVSPVVRFDETVTGVNGIAVRLNPPPRTYKKVAGRKFPWLGDYWRSLVPFGIWKPIKIKARDGIRLDNLYVKPTLTGEGSAQLDISVDVEHLQGAARQFELEARLEGSNFASQPIVLHTEIPPGASSVSLTAHIDDAKRWWPWDLGEPNLYSVTVSATTSDGHPGDTLSTRFGIRAIEMRMNPGFQDDEVQYPWTMLINGEQHFFRSGAWGGPPDIFYGRNSAEKYRILINQAKEANLNNLRIFGWHPTEVKAFYDFCDEAGMTVWQDILPLASVTLPSDDAFRDATYAEAITVVKELRNHPSVVLLEGGEESLYTQDNPEHNKNFLLGIEDAVRPYTNLPYVPASPLSYPETIVTELGFKSKKESVHPHALHYGRAGMLLEEYIAEWDYAVYPEFAASSPPNVESIRKFIPADEVWPPGPSWGHHWADLDTFVALNYQVFGDTRTGSLEEFVSSSQIAQGIVFQWGIEHVRRCKPKSTGISICHFITYAPDMKWGIVDYYQEPKLSYEYVKRAYQPLLISLKTAKRHWLPGEDFLGEIWVVNDFKDEFRNCIGELRITDADSKTLSRRPFKIDRIEKNCSKVVFEARHRVQGEPGETFSIYLTLSDAAGKVLSENHYFLRVADQAQARRDCKAFSDSLKSRSKDFAQADYYRFFPSLSGKQRKTTTGKFESGMLGLV